MIHRNSTVNIPPNRCAFHENNYISHFCRYEECLLPLCKLCLSIHRRQHGNKDAPIDLISIEQEHWQVQNQIQNQMGRLEGLYIQIVGKVKSSHNLHWNLQKGLIAEREHVLHGITLYYDSICQEIDRNFHRREIWLQEITDHYNSTRQEMATILQKLQSEQHLRTIIMWNRLHPHLLIGDIVKQGKKEFETPSLVPCDVQQLITTLSKNHKMTILDLHGDMSFNQLEKVLYTLRYGEEENVFLSKQAGLSIISRESKLSHKLSISKSTDKV